MTEYVVTATASVTAPPKHVYDIVADYHDGHRRILPKAFTDMKVEEGGVGAGTVIQVQMRLFGRDFTFRGFVTEPEPGHHLVERNVGGAGVPDSVTSFIVAPGSTADKSVVTISSTFQGRSGVLGAIERAFSRRAILRLYKEELQLLEEVARAA